MDDGPMLVAIVATVIGGVIAMTVTARRAAVQSEERDSQARKAWQEAAHRLGGRFANAMGGMTISLVDRGASVKLQRLRYYGDFEESGTVARAQYVLGVGPVFGARARYVDSFGRSSRVPFDDPNFDAAFTVRSDEATGTHAVWSRACQQRMVEWLQGGWVVSDGSTVEVRMPGAVDQPEVLQAIVGVTVELASAGAHEFDALASPPFATLRPSSAEDAPCGPRQLVVTNDRGIATATVRWASHGPQVRLVMPTPQRGNTFESKVVNGLLQPPHGVPIESSVALLPKLEGAEVARSETQVAIQWPSIPSAAALRAGAAFLSVLANGHTDSAFR